MATSATITDKSDRAFRTISEAAEVVGVPQHVLRFWETRFPELQPLKRAGNRRYYRPADMALLETIRGMLHDQGLTIRGAKLLLAGADSGARGAARPAERVTAPKATRVTAPQANVPADSSAPAALAPAIATENIGAPVAGIDRAAVRAIRDRLRYALAA